MNRALVWAALLFLLGLGGMAARWLVPPMLDPHVWERELAASDAPVQSAEWEHAQRDMQTWDVQFGISITGTLAQVRDRWKVEPQVALASRSFDPIYQQLDLLGLLVYPTWELREAAGLEWARGRPDRAARLCWWILKDELANTSVRDQELVQLCDDLRALVVSQQLPREWLLDLRATLRDPHVVQSFIRKGVLKKLIVTTRGYGMLPQALWVERQKRRACNYYTLALAAAQALQSPPPQATVSWLGDIDFNSVGDACPSQMRHLALLRLAVAARLYRADQRSWPSLAEIPRPDQPDFALGQVRYQIRDDRLELEFPP